jgi:hypothetical protein
MVDLVGVDKLALVHDLVGKLGNGGGGLERFQLDLARAGLALRDDGVTVVIYERQEGLAEDSQWSRQNGKSGWVGEAYQHYPDRSEGSRSER